MQKYPKKNLRNGLLRIFDSTARFDFDVECPSSPTVTQATTMARASRQGSGWTSFLSAKESFTRASARFEHFPMSMSPFKDIFWGFLFLKVWAILASEHRNTLGNAHVVHN
jgi:hypothetical protein